MRRVALRWMSRGLLVLALLYFLHLIPEREPAPPVGTGRTAFRWQRDAYWQELESEFQRQRASDRAGLETLIESSVKQLQDELIFADVNQSAARCGCV